MLSTRLVYSRYTLFHSFNTIIYLYVWYLLTNSGFDVQRSIRIRSILWHYHLGENGLFIATWNRKLKLSIQTKHACKFMHDVLCVHMYQYVVKLIKAWHNNPTNIDKYTNIKERIWSTSFPTFCLNLNTLLTFCRGNFLKST